MKTNFKIIVIAFLLVILVTASFAQKDETEMPVGNGSKTNVDLGVLDQNTYVNNFFQLKIEFPLGWLVGDNTLEKELLALSQPKVAAKNSKQQKEFDHAVQRITPLLGGYKELPGSSAENSNLKITVENLKGSPQIKTGKDYIESLKNSLRLARLPVGFNVSDAKTERVDNLELSYLETSFQQNKKRLYVFLRKGFAVLITIEYFNEEDFNSLHQVLLDADLNYKK